MDTTIDIFNQISVRIIKEQEAIIGALAWAEASKVEGLEVLNANDTQTVNIKSNDPKTVINNLVSRYEKLFGRLSRDVSRQAVSDLTADIPSEDIPSVLQ